MKHTLGRKHPRRKYQIKTKKSKKLRSNRGRRMVGGYGAEFTQYISSQIDSLKKPEFRDMYQEEDTIYHIVRNIVSGGSFTNKMNEIGFFKPGENLGKLLQSALIFYNWTKGLNESKFRRFTPVDQAAIRGEQVTLYRHVNISPLNAVRNVIQPIPISCTWNIDFAIREWMLANPCCIYEMNIPSTDVFLPLSLPPPEPASRSPVPLNQPQYEVTVAPCILTYTSTRVYNGINVYVYNAKTCANIAEVRANFDRVVNHGCFF